MKRIQKMMTVMALLSCALLTGTATAGVITKNVDIRITDDFLNVSADIILDSLELRSNQQLFVTPVVRGANDEKELPSVLVNGRNMQYAYERGSLKQFEEIKAHEIYQAVRRNNKREQSVAYNVRTPLEEWMSDGGANVEFVLDSCGCGVPFGRLIGERIPIIPEFDNPVKEMQVVMVTPQYKEPPVQIHEGRARVQFEVDKTQLHVIPYVCKNGRTIDNREQIQMIDDSVQYALTDPNVELAGINLCGYASPESPYTHNDMLATGRSKALAEYLADHYNLPKEKVTYSAVPENWGEFRQQVVDSKELTDKQRADLLELIDAPAVTPAEYDRKEQILKTDPRFKELYRTKILPDWFPRLRATTFAIHTRLKPMTDEELMKIIETTPEKMSLNQMFRVARMYPEGSDDFNRVIDIALKYYPNDPTAILNAAAAEVARGEYDKARKLLAKAGDTPEVNNLMGIIETSEGRYEVARTYFEKAGDLPAAQRNLHLLPAKK